MGQFLYPLGRESVYGALPWLAMKYNFIVYTQEDVEGISAGQLIISSKEGLWLNGLALFVVGVERGSQQR